MKKRTTREGASRLVSINQFCAYTGLGLNKAKDFARENGIEIRIGRACRYDLQKTDEVLNTLTSIEKR